MYNDKQTAYAENMTPPPYNVQESQTPLSSNPVYPEPATSPSAGATSSGFDDYETNKSYDNFSEIRVRHRFIMKVYSIVSLQLLITTAFIALFRFYPPLGAYCAQYSGMWILYVSMVGVFVLIFILSCVESVRRHYPSNLILLFVFTGFESVLIGFITTAYSTNVLLKGIGLTGIIVVGLTIFAFQTKYDFTGFGVYLFVFLISLIGFGILAAIFRSEVMETLYAVMGTCLFSFYIVFDTQLMIGGKHKYSISPEEYILAALNIYLDIINLLLFILRILGKK